MGQRHSYALMMRKLKLLIDQLPPASLVRALPWLRLLPVHQDADAGAPHQGPQLPTGWGQSHGGPSAEAWWTERLSGVAPCACFSSHGLEDRTAPCLPQL